MKKTQKTARKTNATVINIDKELALNIRSRITTLLNRKHGHWEGTMTEFNNAITTGLRRTTPLNWPKSPSSLRRVMNGMVNSLSRAGFRISFGRSTDYMRTRFVEIEQR
jgi:hypothetical protein